MMRLSETATVLAERLASPEGPDLLADGRVVLVETFACRVSAWSAERGLHEYAYTGGAPTACMVGLDGVYVAQTGLTAGPWRSPDPRPPSIQRIAPDGSVSIVVQEASGRPLVGPNDLTFAPDGRLWFTDPGTFDEASPDEGTICVVEPDGTATVAVEVGAVFPNGIVAEPDGGIVWNESFTRHVKRLRPDGAVELLATLPEGRIPDGMKLAADGSIWVCGVASNGIDVIAPGGEALDFLATGGVPLNLVFDGEDLLIADLGEWNEEAESGAAGGRLVRVPAGRAGMPLFRGAVGAGA
jgi:gluconolactonase